MRHEISGAHFAYQVSENDSSNSIAARFGEPELTLFPDGSEPEPGGSITIHNRHVAAAAIDEGVVINVPERLLFVFRQGHLAGAWPITVGRPDWPTCRLAGLLDNLAFAESNLGMFLLRSEPKWRTKESRRLRR